MLKQYFFLFFIWLYSSLVWTQNDTIIRGKIITDSDQQNDIHIVNLSSIAVSITDEQGNFSIKVKENDTLMFSAVYLESKKIVISKSVIEKKFITVEMKTATKTLKEVKVIQINPEDLGIVPKNQKKYTPAEKKLIAAETFKWYSPLLIPFGGMSIEGLINAISGRTKTLKKELVVERKELLQEKTLLHFNKEFMTRNLKIPQEHVEGFLFYIADDPTFSDAMNKKNYIQAEFYLTHLAVTFLETREIKPLTEEQSKTIEKDGNTKKD